MKTNLLKSIFISLILVMGVSNTWAYTLYLYTGSFGSWNDSNAKFQVYTNKNINATSLGNNWYSFDVGTFTGTAYIKRMDSSNSSKWNEFSASISSTNNITRVTGWNAGTVADGLYLAGDNWGDIGSWSTNDADGKMTISSGTIFTSKTFTGITASAHEFKIAFKGTWDNAIGHNGKVSCVNGTQVNNGGNIKFTPYIAGDVTITYDVSTGNIVITCPAPTITFDPEGGSGGTSTQSAPYGDATSKITAPTKTGYTFGGYYTGDNGTETQIIGTDGNWIKSKTNFTDANNKWIVTSNKTLYAKWTPIQHTVTFGVHSSGNGTLTAKAGSTTITSGAKVNQGSSITFTATPSIGYQVAGWYSNSGCTSAIAGAGTNTTYTINNLTADKTVYVKFEAIPANNHNITYTTQAAGWTYGAQPTSAEEGATVTFEVIPTTGYTVTVTSNDVSLSKNGSTYTFTMPTIDVTINVSATENTHDVTISYKSGGVILQADAIINVSEANAESIEAPAVSGYAFTGWTLGSGITNKSANTTTNPIDITTKASGEYTLTANYEKERCVYFVNTARWTTIKAYAWNDSGDNVWPGANMTKESEQIGGYDVYKYVMPSGKNYDKLVFNQGKDDGKTGDLEWVDGKYYVYSAGQWVDKNEVADLLPNPVIYFKNNPGWEEVYVYFHTGDYWIDANDGGSGSNGLASGRVCKMEKVGDTDIYKFDYSEKDFVPSNVIAFTEVKQLNHEKFWQTEAAYRTDYNPSMELYIPQKTSSETKNSTIYFNKGLWMKYNSMESGYSITGTINNWDHNADKFTADSLGGYQFETEVLLDGGKDYVLKIKNIKNDWFSTATVLTSTGNTNVEFITEHGNDAKLTTTSDGYYTFSIDLSEGMMMVSVEYPLMVGDYRMVYIESETKGTKPYTKFHPAQSIRYQAEGEKKDTVSFYINKTDGENPAILLQQCTAINGADATWADVAIQYINGNGGADPVLAQAPAKKSAEVHIGNGCPTVTKDAVYNFVLEQTNTGSHKAQILAENTHPYTGNYYIRTDGAKGGWRKYNTNPDNIMTHSQTALTHGGYDYYFCEWMLQGDNVKYVVANDYSYCVSDTLAKDDIVTDENGNLPADANVRYTWNSSTNALKRAYINGSSTIADRYLVLEGNAELQDTLGNVFPKNETTFADMGNWLYQVDVKASEATKVKLAANYNDTTQYFKGDAESAVNIITDANNYYKFRLIYDFKTNYLLCGLTEDGEISENITVDEAMIMRSHHERAQTFNVTNEGSIKTIKTIYGVMNFNKNTLNGAGSEHERALYWVSFPFDVNLGEAFGFGNYGEHWIMEYYDGKERAEKGLWKEPTYSYWKYITNPNDTLKAGKGYVLCLDLDLLGPDADFWNNTNDIALYFPSKDSLITINDQPALKDTEVKPLTCTIERDNRDIYDSNWNIIGVPSYANISDFSTKIDDVNFYYQYNAADNSYISQEATTFNTMHAYMTQFAGTIQWAYKTVVPAPMAARKQSAGKDQYTLRLALQQEDAQCDHTFIRLQEDNVTAEFDMNYDLCKIINSGANIYSMIGNVEVAANVLPVEERIIPLGLDIEEDGNYTFAMPDGTDGITATLIDYETSTEINLLLADYTVELNAGIDNERFALRVRPNHVATAVETIIDGANGQIQKYIINGALYILNNGQLYDAQGRMIQQ